MSQEPSSPRSADAAGRPAGLVIRATRLDDYEAVATLINLPGFRAGTLRLPYQRPEQVRKWPENQNPDGLNIVAVLGDRIVGQAGLERYGGRRAHAAGLGMGVHDDHYRQCLRHPALRATRL